MEQLTRYIHILVSPNVSMNIEQGISEKISVSKKN